ncbi:hypothetical protein ACFL3Q_06315 [Planctomycetota bacterium]
MNRMPKSTWYYIVTILLLMALGIYIAAEIAVLRKVPAVLGRFAPFLTFWSNIVLSLALRPNESIPIWIVPVLNLGVLLAAIVVYKIAIPVLRSCACEGEKS